MSKIDFFSFLVILILIYLLVNTGTKTTATTKEHTREITTVKVKPSKTSLMIPSFALYKINGRNTQIVVNVEAEIAIIISDEPKTAAVFGFAPFSR